MISPAVCLRTGSFVALMIAVVATAGCKDPPAPTFPVSGKVTQGKKALTTGLITFVPDASKGNNNKENPVGRIGPDGSYTLNTNGRDGAPLGWYKVMITATMPTEMPTEVKSETKAPPKGPPPVPKSPVNSKYQKAETSGISVEVTDPPKPGAYDIDLK